MERCQSRLGASWSAARAVLRPLGALLEPPRGLLGRCWSHVRPPRVLLEPSGGLLERCWARLEASWSAAGAVSRPLRAMLSPLGVLLRPSGRSSGSEASSLEFYRFSSRIFESAELAEPCRRRLEASCSALGALLKHHSGFEEGSKRLWVASSGLEQARRRCEWPPAGSKRLRNTPETSAT